MSQTDVQAPPNLSPPTPNEKVPAGSDDHPKQLSPERLLDRIKKRFQNGAGAFEENRRLHSEDLNFVYNTETQAQWDPAVLAARIGKPCYTFNRVLGPVNMVVADMRQTRPSGKVRPKDGSATQIVADILAGLCRSIEDSSRASVIYKQQYKYAVAGGFGAWRIMPEYAGDDTFDQVIRIKDIPNPQCVVWDPEATDPCCADAMWAVVGDRISKEKHAAIYGKEKAEGVTFEMGRDNYGWYTDGEVRVAEYFERVPFEKTIALLSDNRVIEYDDAQKAADEHLQAAAAGGKDVQPAAKVVKTRKVLKWRVMWVKCDGANILEGPIFYDWKRIPVVRCPGRYVNIEGRMKLQSLIRHSKDAQRAYNSRASDMIERSALIPKAPYLVTKKMIQGFEDMWSQANTASRPYLAFNIDKDAAEAGVQGGAPQRAQPIDMPSAAIALAQQAIADIQATTGFFDPAMGNADDMNRVSGKALVQHTRRSDLGSYEFIDGYGEAVQLTWEIMVDMIPTVYDAERIERIIGPDDVEQLLLLNEEKDDGRIVNDLKKGAYDCKVTLGPSFQTARQEHLDTLLNFVEAVPNAQALIPDLIAKNVDTPDSEEMVRRLRLPLIQQGIVQPTEKEKMLMPPPKPPDPVQQAEARTRIARAAQAESNAALAQHKVAELPLVTHGKMLQTAGRDLNNHLLAKKLGEPDEAAEAEEEASSSTPNG